MSMIKNDRKTESLSISLPTDVVKKITVLAARNTRSVSGQILHLIRTNPDWVEENVERSQA